MNLAPRSATIFVFAKPPIADRAKTRLAADVGAPLATALAKAFLHDLWSIACAIPWADAVLAGTEPDPVAYGLDRSVPIEVQGEGDLGVRMERMLLRGLARSRHAFVVGTDGRASGIKVIDSTIDNEGVISCVKGKVGEIQFPRIAHPLDWSYRFVMDTL